MKSSDGAMVSFWVQGQPAPFSTKGERPWKVQLEEQLPAPHMGGGELGISLRFVIAEPTSPRFTPDLDNLCEPVFSVLVNQKRWFGGRRPNILFWQASREVGSPTGCRLAVRATGPQEIGAGAPLWDGIFSGTMPTSARSPELADWARQLRAASPPMVSPERFVLQLAFGSRRLNLGDIATGAVKSVIDCLFPFFGGVAGAPEDHRITALSVEKGVEGADESSVCVRVWGSTGLA